MEGSTDIGGTRTSIAMQFAEALSIPVEDVKPRVGDTEEIGYTDVTGGSRVTYGHRLGGLRSGSRRKGSDDQAAANHWETTADEVLVEEGLFKHRGDSDKQLNFKELSAIISASESPVIGRASVNLGFGVGGSFATNVVDVEVDPDTGKVKSSALPPFQDAARRFTPATSRDRCRGGSVQGIGWALNEEYFYNDDGVRRIRPSSTTAFPPLWIFP